MTQAATADEMRAQTTASPNEAEEAQAGRADDIRVEATDKDWSSWPDDSSFSLLEEKDTSSSTVTESQSVGS
ncbi:hypothetical protein MRX96_048024 [Rhipicephalus microplus]